MSAMGRIVRAGCIALVAVKSVHGQLGSFSGSGFGGRDSFSTGYNIYSRYANVAEAKAAVDEKRSQIRNLEFLKGDGKGRLPQLETQLSQFRDRSNEAQNALWQEYWKLKAEGAKPDLSAYENEIAEIKVALREKLQNYDADIQETRSLIVGNKEKREIADLETKINVLKAEKRAALEELRQGRYCSQCKRPASMIQRQENVSFQKHLGDVKGKPVPATQDMMDHVAKKYDTKIKAYEGRIASLRTSIRRQEAARERKINSLHDRSLAAEKRANDRMDLLRQRKREAANRSETEFENKLKSVQTAINERERDAERMVKGLREDIAELRKRDHEVELQLIRLRSELSMAEYELRGHERRELVAKQERLREEVRQYRRLQEEHRRTERRLAAAKKRWSRPRGRTFSSRSSRNDNRSSQLAQSEDDQANKRSQVDETPTPRDPSPNETRIEEVRRATEEKLAREHRASAARLERAQRQIGSKLTAFRQNAAKLPAALADARESMENWMREELGKDLAPWMETEPRREFLEKQIAKHVRVPSFNPLDHLRDRGRAAVKKVKNEILDDIQNTVLSLNKTAENYHREWRKWNSGKFKAHYGTIIDAATLPRDDSFENRMNSHMDRIRLNVFTLRSDAMGYVNRFGQYVDDMYADIQKEVFRGFSDDDEDFDF